NEAGTAQLQPERLFLHFGDLKSRVVAELRRAHPFRSWLAPPATVRYDAGSNAYDCRPAKDVFDFLYNSSHAAQSSMLSSSAANSRAQCRILLSVQQNVPV